MLIFIIGFTVTCILPGIVPDQSLPAPAPVPTPIPEIQPSVKARIITIMLNILSMIQHELPEIIRIIRLLIFGT
jgi:hypothetical protein